MTRVKEGDFYIRERHRLPYKWMIIVAEIVEVVEGSFFSKCKLVRIKQHFHLLEGKKEYTFTEYSMTLEDFQNQIDQKRLRLISKHQYDCTKSLLGLM